ncbi:complement C1q tumor necrosis factor-related protein 3-like [Heterodontus francisci]|uniref:complement C1q tumor necrosis factor-related protein 3-like n=1 Tax=Heterodontus francisci TaxID=7792 RepID=UPI00355B094B
MILKALRMDSSGLGNLLCLIVLLCIHQISTLENVLGDLQGAADEEIGQRDPLKLIKEAKDRLGAAYTWSSESDVVFDVQRSTLNHVLAPGATILYDKINVNVGGAYSNETGKFTCPRCGLYFFCYSALPNKGKETDVFLIKNEVTVAQIHSVLVGESSQLSSKCLILDLHKGDQVWVKLVKGFLWSRNGSLSFLGFLLTCKH